MLQRIFLWVTIIGSFIWVTSLSVFADAPPPNQLQHLTKKEWRRQQRAERRKLRKIRRRQRRMKRLERWFKRRSKNNSKAIEWRVLLLGGAHFLGVVLLVALVVVFNPGSWASSLLYWLLVLTGFGLALGLMVLLVGLFIKSFAKKSKS